MASNEINYFMTNLISNETDGTQNNKNLMSAKNEIYMKV